MSKRAREEVNQKNERKTPVNLDIVDIDGDVLGITYSPNRTTAFVTHLKGGDSDSLQKAQVPVDSQDENPEVLNPVGSSDLNDSQNNECEKTKIYESEQDSEGNSQTQTRIENGSLKPETEVALSTNLKTDENLETLLGKTKDEDTGNGKNDSEKDI